MRNVGRTYRREFEELADWSNMVDREEPVSRLHDLFHVLLPDVPEPGAKGPLPGASGLP